VEAITHPDRRGEKIVERITSNKVHGYVEWLRGSGFKINIYEDGIGIRITNESGDTYISGYGTPKEIMRHFLSGYLEGWKVGKKEKDNEPVSQ
jgi:hypothetical protein